MLRSFAITLGFVVAGDGYELYARALRAFNPALTQVAARALAVRTVAEADAAGFDARLLVALVAVESGWRPGSRSAAGAAGLGQLMPQTAREVGVDPADPAANLHGSALYLAGLLRRYRSRRPGEQYVRALAAYNAGPAAVDRAGGIPPFAETQRYVRNVLGLWARLCGR